MMVATKCPVHGGHLVVNPAFGATNPPYRCQTEQVLADVGAERARQFERYGDNSDLEWGSGPETRWLLPYTDASAERVEDHLRGDYEDYEEELGAPTFVHLVREEVAEAFKESDPVRLREELIQVAALAVSWVEKIDAKEAGL